MRRLAADPRTVVRPVVLRPVVARPVVLLRVVVRRGVALDPPPLLLVVAISTPFSVSLNVSNVCLYPGEGTPLQTRDRFYRVLNSRRVAFEPSVRIAQLVQRRERLRAREHAMECLHPRLGDDRIAEPLSLLILAQLQVHTQEAGE